MSTGASRLMRSVSPYTNSSATRSPTVTMRARGKRPRSCARSVFIARFLSHFVPVGQIPMPLVQAIDAGVNVDVDLYEDVNVNVDVDVNDHVNDHADDHADDARQRSIPRHGAWRRWAVSSSAGGPRTSGRDAAGSPPPQPV